MGRYLLTALMLGAFAFAQEVDRRVLNAEGRFERVRLFLDEKWIAVNHTPAVIKLKINEAESYIEVAALRKSGEGLVEIAPLGEKQSRYIYFNVVDRSKPDAFRWVIGDIAKGAPPVLSYPPHGTLAFEGDSVSYSGEPKGDFTAVYADKNNGLIKKRVTITKRGLIAIDALLEIEEGAKARLPFWSAFKFEPIIALEPTKGEAYIDDKGLTFIANEGAEGGDRLIFIPFADAEPITIDIKIIKRSNGGLTQTQRVKTFGGVSRTIKALDGGGFSVEFRDAQKRLLLNLAAPPNAKLTERDDGCLINIEEIALTIENNASVRAAIGKSQISIEPPSSVVVLSGAAIEAKTGRGALYADRYGVRLFSGDLAYPLLPSASEARLSAEGFWAKAVLLGEDRFLPFGWIYGENAEGELERFAIIDESEAFLSAKWGGAIALEYGGERFVASPIRSRKVTAFLRYGWNPFAPIGDLRIDRLIGVTKVIETAENDRAALWAQYDSRLPQSLNRLHRMHSGQLYQVFAAQDGEIELEVFPQSPIWLKEARYVGVGETENAPLTLPEGFRLIDFNGYEARNYQAGEFYRLERAR
ncbi:MAG: hypothetical protein LBO72_07785 [Helicobacteraceae bacterium]|jgi:hypothetical protein|nr:hypothetical protein [Helicobacteraceae bacterium]